MAATTDWEAIEREFRAGQLSVREIARQYGVSHVAIGKRAKAKGWTKNLADQVREAVATKLVTGEVASGTTGDAVETAAQRGVELVRSHRKDIATGRALAKALFDELEESTTRRAEIETEIYADTADDKKMDRRNAMLRAVALPARASVLQSLSGAVKTFIALERQAFNLDGQPDGDDRNDRRDSTEVAKAIASKLARLAPAAGSD